MPTNDKPEKVHLPGPKEILPPELYEKALADVGGKWNVQIWMLWAINWLMAREVKRWKREKKH